MAANPRIFLLVVLLAVISLATSNGIQGSVGLGFEVGVGNELQGENNDTHRGIFGFPYSGIIFRDEKKVDIESGVSAEHQSGNRDQTDLTKTPNKLSHEDPQYLHNRGAYNSDTDNERKFRWPNSVGITISRSNKQNSELGADTNDYIGQGGLNHEHHHHNHSAGNNDADGERKFRWPNSVTIGFTRSNEQNSELGADTDYYIGQAGLNHEHHHHNHSAGNNDSDGERKFRWPNIGLTISRSNKQNSGEDDETKFFGLIPSLAPCNHTEQAGRSCYDCTHTLLCFANDIGIKRNCSPLYCNQGRCAAEPSDECSSST